MYAVLEGQQTEKTYVEFIAKMLPGQHGVRIVAEVPGAARTTLFNKAKAIAQDSDDDSEVWVICDVDDEGETLRELVKRTFEGSQRLHWAISNPAFAVWLVMHFQSCTRWEHRDLFARAAVELGVAIGKKGKGIDTSLLLGKAAGARRNAIIARKNHVGSGNALPENNPQSDVDLFVQRVIDLYNEQVPAGCERLDFSSIY